MTSPTRRSGPEVCWNCDRPTDVTVEIIICWPDCRWTRFRLCESCYRTVHQPLVDEMGAPALIVGEAPETRQQGSPTGGEG